MSFLLDKKDNLSILIPETKKRTLTRKVVRSDRENLEPTGNVHLQSSHEDLGSVPAGSVCLLPWPRGHGADMHYRRPGTVVHPSAVLQRILHDPLDERLPR
jgi:hypothetical protein